MDALVPGGMPVVVDIRRRKIHQIGRRPYKRDFEAYLVAEAASMAILWEQLTA